MTRRKLPVPMTSSEENTMSKLLTMLTACLFAATMQAPAFAADAGKQDAKSHKEMAEGDYKAAKAKAEGDEKAAKAACKKMSGADERACKKEADAAADTAKKQAKADYDK